MIMPEKIMVGLTDSEYRPCKVLFQDEDCNYKTGRGLFHKWTMEASSSELGSLKTDAITSLAIVELEDGRVVKIVPDYIRFLDTKYRMDQIDWGDVGHGTENARNCP